MSRLMASAHIPTSRITFVVRHDFRFGFDLNCIAFFSFSFGVSNFLFGLLIQQGGSQPSLDRARRGAVSHWVLGRAGVTPARPRKKTRPKGAVRWDGALRPLMTPCRLIHGRYLVTTCGR